VGSVERLFLLWVREMGKTPSRTRLTPERRRVLRARLRDYSEETIAQAIKGCALSDFHMGRNERRRRYNDLTLICRNGSKLESFAEMVEEPTEQEFGPDGVYREPGNVSDLEAAFTALEDQLRREVDDD